MSQTACATPPFWFRPLSPSLTSGTAGCPQVLASEAEGEVVVGPQDPISSSSRRDRPRHHQPRSTGLASRTPSLTTAANATTRGGATSEEAAAPGGRAPGWVAAASQLVQVPAAAATTVATVAANPKGPVRGPSRKPAGWRTACLCSNLHRPSL